MTAFAPEPRLVASVEIHREKRPADQVRETDEDEECAEHVAKARHAEDESGEDGEEYVLKVHEVYGM
ncbi:MAG TPA: hypothetical protein VHD69_02825 [Candidatus Paceibacterota bacterium]|jgi:hypothetical protein|nr:hypothetical protein [Candidatus Paceibacterota bacterium]